MRPSFHQIVWANALGSKAEQVGRGNWPRILLLKETLLTAVTVTIDATVRAIELPLISGASGRVHDAKKMIGGCHAV